MCVKGGGGGLDVDVLPAIESNTSSRTPSCEQATAASTAPALSWGVCHCECAACVRAGGAALCVRVSPERWQRKRRTGGGDSTARDWTGLDWTASHWTELDGSAQLCTAPHRAAPLCTALLCTPGWGG